jgi:hypothetical protein
MAIDWSIRTNEIIDEDVLENSQLEGDIYINSKGDIAKIGYADNNDDMQILVGMDIQYGLINNRTLIFEKAQEDVTLAESFVENLFADDIRLETFSASYNEDTNILIINYSLDTALEGEITFSV